MLRGREAEVLETVQRKREREREKERERERDLCMLRRGEAEVVLAVAPCPAFEQRHGRLSAAGTRSRVQRRSLVHVACVDLGTSSAQKAHDARVVVPGSKVQGRVSVVIGAREIGAVTQERLNQRGVALGGCGEEEARCRLPVLDGRLEVVERQRYILAP